MLTLNWLHDRGLTQNNDTIFKQINLLLERSRETWLSFDLELVMLVVAKYQNGSTEGRRRENNPKHCK